MATFQFSARRLTLAGGFAVAVAAVPAVAAFAVPAAGGAPALAACPNGESEDIYTGVCVPDIVPNSPEGQTSPGGLPEINGIPCSGANTGQCIGLSEVQQPPVVMPHSSVSSSP